MFPAIVTGKYLLGLFIGIATVLRLQPTIFTDGGIGQTGLRSRFLPRMTDRLKILLIIDTVIKQKPLLISLDGGQAGRRILIPQ